MTGIDAQQVNRIIEEETKRCIQELRSEQSRLGIKPVSGNLSKVNYKLQRKNAQGIYSKVSFFFPRYGIFVHKGAGRGKAGKTGSQWRNQKGIIIHTNPLSFDKMNTGGRRAKEWFNPVVERFSSRLTERLTEHFVIVAYQRLNIK